MVLVLWYYLRLLINDQNFLCVLKAFSFQVKENVRIFKNFGWKTLDSFHDMSGLLRFSTFSL